MSVGRAPGEVLTDEQRIAWLRLIRTDNVGPATFRLLLNRFGSAEAALAVLPRLAHSGGRSTPAPIVPEHAAREEIERLAAMDARLVAMGEPGYPDLLRHIPGPPPMIAVLGGQATDKFDLDWSRTVGIVGARNASTASIPSRTFPSPSRSSRPAVP